MCGLIAFMLPVDRENLLKKDFQILLYHLGRSLAYSIIGSIFGLIGKSFSLFGLQQQLSVVVGLLMIVLVVLPTKTVSKFSMVKPIFGLM